MSYKRDLISITDLTPEETLQIVSRAVLMKSQDVGKPLQGKKFALLFEKPSLRTRVSFQVGIAELGEFFPLDSGLRRNDENQAETPLGSQDRRIS